MVPLPRFRANARKRLPSSFGSYAREVIRRYRSVWPRRATADVIHRDIKPQNILVGYEADGLRARISDFGLAKKVNPLTLFATAAGMLSFNPSEIFTQQK